MTITEETQAMSSQVNSSTWSMPLGAAPSEGELCIACMLAPADRTVTYANGWAEILKHNYATSAPFLTMAWKIAGSGDPATPTLSLSAVTNWLSFQVVLSTNNGTWDTLISQEAGADARADPIATPSLSLSGEPTVENVALAFGGIGATETPSNWTETYNTANSQNTLGQGGILGWKEVANSGSTSPTADLTGSLSHAAILAIINVTPADGSGPWYWHRRRR